MSNNVSFSMHTCSRHLSRRKQVLYVLHNNEDQQGHPTQQQYNYPTFLEQAQILFVQYEIEEGG